MFKFNRDAKVVPVLPPNRSPSPQQYMINPMMNANPGYNTDQIHYPPRTFGIPNQINTSDLQFFKKVKQSHKPKRFGEMYNMANVSAKNYKSRTVYGPFKSKSKSSKSKSKSPKRGGKRKTKNNKRRIK